MSKEKEFFGTASLIVNFNFEVSAKDIEEVKEKIFSAIRLDLKLKDKEDKEPFQISDVNDWYIVNEAQEGNIRQALVDDLYIEEEE